VKVPETDDEKQSFSSALGSYQTIAQEGDEAKNGPLGAITALDGTVIKQSNDPDFNGFIPASTDGSEGYLFTNWEDRPGLAVEGLRFSVATRSPVRSRKAAELEETRFVGMQRQPEPREAVAQFGEDPFGVPPRTMIREAWSAVFDN
jgi:hypothetical protein